MGKFSNTIKKLKRISIVKYVYLNYFCSHIIRDKNVHIIPYKGACLEFQKKSKLYLKGKDLIIGINKIKDSKAETYVRLKENAVWRCNNGANLVYNTTIEVHEKALLETGFFYANVATSVVCTKHIRIGEGVWLGRNIVIYDSDYHQIQDENGKMTNFSKPVVIGNHVWLTNQIIVLKGVTIGEGSVVAPMIVIRKDVPKESMVGMEGSIKVFKKNVKWSPDRVTDWGLKNE